MKKTTILALAGLFALTGCKQFVMEERVYADPDSGKPKAMTCQEDPLPAPAVEAPAPAPVAKPAAAPVEFEPMPMRDYYKNVGITSPDRQAKRSGKCAAMRVSAKGGVYIVKPGDTLGKIAYAHGVSLGNLMKQNNLTMKDARTLRPGRKLTIPGKSTVVSRRSNKRSAAAVAATGKLLNSDGTYTVRRGDSIPKIARKLKIKARDLQSANNLTDEATRRLQIGQKLIVPGTKGVAVPAAQTVDVSVKPVETVAPVDAVNSALPAADSVVAPQDSEVAPQTNSAPTDSAAPVVAPQDNSAASVNTAAAETTKTDLYTLEKDMTVAELAKAKNTTVEVLLAINPALKSDSVLKADDIIFIPIKK